MPWLSHQEMRRRERWGYKIISLVVRWRAESSLCKAPTRQIQLMITEIHRLSSCWTKAWSLMEKWRWSSWTLQMLVIRNSTDSGAYQQRTLDRVDSSSQTEWTNWVQFNKRIVITWTWRKNIYSIHAGLCNHRVILNKWSLTKHSWIRTNHFRCLRLQRERSDDMAHM